MSEGHVYPDLNERTSIFFRQIICIFIDAAFLCLWVLIQWIAKLVVEKLSPSGIDLWVLWGLQAVFAVSTL
ncbi:MAG: hypothetical protein WBD28_03655, partial [Candidatus Zixiibacteriota bacterium]